MANKFVTPDMIAPKALEKFKNQLNMAMFVDRQLDNTYSKKGDTISVRRLTRFAAVDGGDLTGQLQDIVEGKVPVRLDFYKSVGIPITSSQLTVDLKDFNEQVTEPAVIELAQTVESSLAGLYNKVWNQVGTAGTTPTTIQDAMLPKQKLDLVGVPDDNKRSAFYEPISATTLAASLGTVFPTNIANMAIEEGEIRRYAGFVFMQNQSIVRHTCGTFNDATAAVNGANQNVTYESVADNYQQTLAVDGFGANDTLNAGDRIEIDGVFAVNAKTRQSTGQLAQFVVLEDVTLDGTGAGNLTIASPIIIDGAQQTVTAAPADNASISVISGASGEVVAQNLAMHKNAFTLAFAPLAPFMGGAKSTTYNEYNMSIRISYGADIVSDQNIVRFDILYAAVAQNPGMACVHVSS
jgi:hypothetical protein